MTDIAEQMDAEREEQGGRKLNPRQRKLVTLLLDVELGKLTITEAMEKAGYAKSTAEQQSETLRNLRENSAMQQALRAAGFTEDVIARKVVEGIDASQSFVLKDGDKWKVEKAPDLDIQH